MAASAPHQDLVDLDDTGCKVDSQGVLSNWADQPSSTARPVMEPTEAKKARREFSPGETARLTQWCQSAERENGLSGSAAFVDFECLFPSRSWRAYEAKWRQGKQSLNRVRDQSYDDFFPNFDLAARQVQPSIEGTEEQTDTTTASPQVQPSIQGRDEQTDTATATPPRQEPDDLTYNDFRTDALKNLLRALDLSTVVDLEAFLNQNWVKKVYIEYHSDCLESTRQSDGAFLKQHTRLPSAKTGRSNHQWKINRALTVLQAVHSKYLEEKPDKSLWTADDHDVRFIIQLVKAGVLPGRTWSHEIEAREDWEPELAYRGFHLMEWLRWVYKLSIGTSRESLRAQNRKNQWLAFLKDLRSAEDDDLPEPILPGESRSLLPSLPEQKLANPSPERTPTSTVDPAEPQRIGDCWRPEDTTACAADIRVDPAVPLDAPASVPGALAISAEELDRRLEVFASLPGGPSTTSANPSTEGGSANKGPPQYEVKRSRNANQERGIFWLTEEAYKIYQKQRDKRLNGWGVSDTAVGTCVLVPALWAEVEPASVLQSLTPEQLLQDASSEDRLWLSLGDTNVLWARACAWFESWPASPRRGIDLDQFLVGPDGQWPEMHGSHLCHHGMCIQPRHIVYETKTDNLSRHGCHTTARSFRSYGIPIPSQCKRHDPPCLLQHAALTTVEAICVQLFVLRLALDLPLSDTWTRPADHPSLFDTFETKLPLTFPAAAVCVDPGSLVEPPLRPDDDLIERFSIRCAFCPAAQRQWSHITAYWSHVKIRHPGIPKTDRLQEVRRSAHQYLAWIDARGLDYQKRNAATMQKLREAQAPDFSWEVFEHWRLTQDRFNERVVERHRRENNPEAT